MLMDAWCFKHTHSPYDKDGQLARSGKAIPALFSQFLSDAYFELPFPKSTGRELFNLNWLAQFESVNHHTIEDVQATLLELTAVSIAQEVEKHVSGLAPNLLVCGGGAMNPALMNRLGTLLPNWTVADTKDRGIDSELMEVIDFSWLAHRRIHGLPSNLPEVTGASNLASLGIIYT
jgi:anhydro-N-acetylmuramic acid kinase